MIDSLLQEYFFLLELENEYFILKGKNLQEMNVHQKVIDPLLQEFFFLLELEN